MTEATKLHLRQIMDILEDGNLGYEKLANQFKQYDVSTIFRRLSQQRKMFKEELKYECLVQGENIMVTGTMAGFFHRTLIGLKEPFVSEESLIDMAVDGEKAAIEVYESNIDHEIPRFLKEKLEQQLILIKGAIPQLHNFKEEVTES
jgi:uncharacterized protein (TIGR02284 family)